MEAGAWVRDLLDSGQAVEAADSGAFDDQAQLETLNQSDWSDWLSVHSSGKININTAKLLILNSSLILIILTTVDRLLILV